MTRTPYERMARLAASATPFAVATVVRTQGSTPQVVGAKLVVTAEDGERPFGTLGGGCVEADAILAARRVLAGEAASVREYRLNEDLAWNTGLVCGGTMWILAEPGESAATVEGRSLLDAAVRAASGGPPLAVLTCLVRDEAAFRPAGRAWVLADGTMTGSLGSRDADAEARARALEQMRHGTPRLATLADGRDLLIEPVTSRPRLVIAGGGHVARAIARQARLVDFDVTVLEDRPEFADPERFDGAEVVTGDLPTSLAAFDYGWQSYVVIATRGHKLDADCVLAAVRAPVRYIGVLGSRRKTVLLARMLREAGIEEERIRAVRAPVGLDLGGRTPAEIALAVLAEITQERYAGTGRPFSLAGD